MIEMFVALAVGYILNRRGYFNADSNRRISDLIVTVTSPALILSSVSEPDQSARGETVTLLLIGFAIYILVPVFAGIVSKLLRVTPDKSGTFQALLIFGNTGFMGIPVVSALYGRSAIFFASILHMPFNLLVFTYGLILLGGGENKLTPKEKFRQIMNPGLFAGIAAILIFFSGIQIPDMIMKPVSFIGDITPALSMIVLGSILAEYPARSLLKEKTIWPVAVFRLAVIPLIIWACTLPFVSDPTLSGIILITNAMPCGAMCAMLSAKYDGNEQLASTGVFATTMISLVTIPVLCMTLLA